MDRKLKSVTNKLLRYTALITMLAILIPGCGLTTVNAKPAEKTFSAERAYADVEYQVDLGSRIPGFSAHQNARQWIQSTLEDNGWETEIQAFTSMGHNGYNIVAKRGTGAPWIILGSHYDSRMVADNDPQTVNRTSPVPGANDGASSTAVLLELARVLPELDQGQVWLVFFDLEDQGNLAGWDWILGSKAFAANLKGNPDAVVILDMIGDKDLNIYKEYNSDKTLLNEIWDSAASLGYQEQFINSYKHRMLDDHIPFIQRGIRAADLIDFNYPYWHTISDTPEMVSPQSLERVGLTITKWLGKTLSFQSE